MLRVDFGDVSVEFGFRVSVLGFREARLPPARAERDCALATSAAGVPPARAQREGGPGGEFRGLLRPRCLIAGGGAPRLRQGDSGRRSPPGPPSRSARTGGTPAALAWRAVVFTGEPSRKFESQTRKKPACLAESPAGFGARDLHAPGPETRLRRRRSISAAPAGLCGPASGNAVRATLAARRSCVNLRPRGGAPIHRPTDEAARRRPGAAAQRNRGHRRKRQPAIAIAPRKMRRGPPPCRNIHP
jgi:hypothetical protein